MRDFDSVWHAGLINKLETLGIKGPLLRIIDKCYTDMKSAVFLNGVTSSSFAVNLGVRHRGVLSTVLYKLLIDDMLNQSENSNCGIILRDINCGNPAFADDIALLALSPTSMQTLVNIYFTNSQNWKFEFISVKADILIFHRGLIVSTYPFVWKLGNQLIQIAKTK